MGAFLEGAIGADTVPVLHTRKVSCPCTERAEDTEEQAQDFIFSGQACPAVICAWPQYYLAAFREDAVAGGEIEKLMFGQLPRGTAFV